LIQKWSRFISDSDGETLIPVETDLLHMTADTLFKVALGRDFDFLNSPDSTVVYDMRKIVSKGFARASSPIWYWRIPLIGQYLDGLGFSIDRIHKLLHSIVASTQDGMYDKGSLFLNKIDALMKAENSYLQQDRLVGNILTLFIGGTDTTGKTLAITLYLLAKDRALQKHLQSEVDGLDLEQCTLEDLFDKAPRLKSFLHEVHRVFCSPQLFLYTTKDIDFCGAKLPKGSNVIIFHRYMLKNADKAQVSDIPRGPDQVSTTVFYPERYLVQQQPELDGSWTCPSPKPGSLSFAGFGLGIRSCPGRTYSEALSYCVLIAILQNMNLKPADGSVEPNYVLRTIMMPHFEICLKLTKRNNK